MVLEAARLGLLLAPQEQPDKEMQEVTVLTHLSTAAAVVVVRVQLELMELPVAAAMVELEQPTPSVAHLLPTQAVAVAVPAQPLALVELAVEAQEEQSPSELLGRPILVAEEERVVVVQTEESAVLVSLLFLQTPPILLPAHSLRR